MGDDMNCWDYKAMQIYNEINALCENNRNGRYDKQIAEKRSELNEVLKKCT